MPVLPVHGSEAMSRRDLAINIVLLLSILGVTFAQVTFRKTGIEPPSKAKERAQKEAGPVRIETNPIMVAALPAERYAVIAEVNPFRTIITPTPLPTPPPPTPTPPPPIGNLMQIYQLIMMDPPNSVTLLDRTTQQMIEWKVGVTRTVSFQGLKLDVTLKRVDPNEFRAEFTAPINQSFSYSFFGK
jgi:hypothetical protein